MKNNLKNTQKSITFSIIIIEVINIDSSISDKIFFFL